MIVQLAALDNIQAESLRNLHAASIRRKRSRKRQMGYRILLRVDVDAYR
jgi:hypothetical protein